jgi:ribonuclease HI
MNTDNQNQDEKIFNVVKTALKEAAHSSISSFNADYISTHLNHKGLEDAQVLLRMIKREVEAHNAKVRAFITRIENTPYSQNWRNSFIGKNEIIVKKAIKSVAEAAEKDYYEIYHHHLRPKL